MDNRRIVAVWVVLIFVSAGCAGQRTSAPNPASAAAAVTVGGLSGTWRGETWVVGSDTTSVLTRDVTLEIKDDATYRLTSTRTGTGAGSTDSGVAVAERDAVVLKSSTGKSTRLQRNGDRLYGVVTAGERSMSIMMEKAG
jgi:hypothetical protein